MAKFYLLGNAGYGQMFGAVVKTANYTVVIDGGTTEDAEQLSRFLREKANNQIDLWLFTHAHQDHIGAFCKMEQSAPDVMVKKIAYRFPSVEDLMLREKRHESECLLWENVQKWPSRHPVHFLSENDVFQFDDVTITCLRVHNSQITNNFVNNSSAVFYIQGNSKSILILGDLGVEGGEEVMGKYPPEMLNADYTQMAHHGQNGVSRQFYEYIRPQRCLWPTPQWLWDNDLGDGNNTGPFQTIHTRSWMAELGVTEHIIAKDGTQKINI